jgi:hypothetical protein
MHEFHSINIGLLILIWMVQIIIYPAFHNIEKSSFIDWHNRYTKAISCFVIPLMWIQVILALKIGFTSGFHFWLNLQILCIAIVWLATFLGAVPCHKQLSLGHNPKTIDRLIGYNWIRTVFWSVVSLIDFLGDKI